MAEGSGHSVEIQPRDAKDATASPTLSRYVSAGVTPAAARTRAVEARQSESAARVEHGEVAGGDESAKDAAASEADAKTAAPEAPKPPAAAERVTPAHVASKGDTSARPAFDRPAPGVQRATATRPSTTTDVGPMLPVATTPPPPKREKVPFWRRIAMQRGESSKAKGVSIEPLVTRIGALEQQISANHATTLSRLENLEQNITRLWELEEQLTLSEVRERLAVMEANQEEIADGMHAVARNLAIVAVVLALAVSAGVLTLGILL